MKKRNFWAKCIAFLLVVVMVLSEQNITTLGETIGSYAQERMAGSSEQETERAIIKEDSSQESSSADGSSSSSSETSQAESSATQNDSQQTQQTGKNSDAGSAQTDQGTSAPSGQQALTDGASDVDNAGAQNEKKTADDKKNNRQNAQKKQKAKTEEQNDANQQEENQNAGNNSASLDDTIRDYYGDVNSTEDGNRPTASVTIRQIGEEEESVKAGSTIDFRVEYFLNRAGNYNYGNQRQPLFDTYEDTQIVMSLPEGISIIDDGGVLANAGITLLSPTKENPNVWILKLSDSIPASSDSTGSFDLTMKINGNGFYGDNHEFDFGNSEDMMKIETWFTIKDRTDSSNVTDKGRFNKIIGTDSKINEDNKLTTETNDVWAIKKSAAEGDPEIVVGDDGQKNVKISFNLEVGLESNGEIINSPSNYGLEGRVPFKNGNDIILTEKTVLYNSDNTTLNETKAEKITITPQFGERSPQVLKIGDNNYNEDGELQVEFSIPVDTCANHAEIADKVDSNAPFYSQYRVDIEYPYDVFVSQYYDDVNIQKGPVVQNTATITYQLKGQQEKTSDSSATKQWSDVTEPAKLVLKKMINGKVYTQGNFGNNDPVKGDVKYSIKKNEQGNTENLIIYQQNADGTYSVLSKDGEVTYAPSENNTTGELIVYLDPGTYTVSEIGLPAYTEKITAGSETAEDKTVTLVAGENEPLIFYNKENLGQIKIIKTGIRNGQKINLPGAKFGIYKDLTCEDPVKDSRDQAITATTDEDGIATFDRLGNGTYYVKELEAPSGYVLDDAVYTLTLDETNREIGQSINNNYSTAEATFKKQIIDVNDSNNPKDLNATNYKIFDGCFTVERQNEDKTWTEVDGYKKFSLDIKGTKKLTLQVYEADGITPIQYRIKEVLPEGWHADNEYSNDKEENGIVYHTFTMAGYLNGTIKDPITMVNTRNGSIALTKDFYTAEKNGMAKNQDTSLTATFELYSITGDATTAVKVDKTLSPVTAGGTINITDLPRTAGKQPIKYYLVETGSSASDYNSSETGGINSAEKTQITVLDAAGGGSRAVQAYGPFDFTEAIDGSSEEIVLEQSITITNVENKVPVVVQKFDSYDYASKKETFVPGAEYTIWEYVYDDVTMNWRKGTVVINNTEIDSEDGSLAELNPGKQYVIEETYIPEGYKQAGYKNETDNKTGTDNLIIDLRNVTVDKDTDARQIVILNKPDPSFKITKVRDNASGGDTLLTDVEFLIYIKNTKTNKFEPVKKADDSTLTIIAGEALRIEAGTYYLKEKVKDDNSNHILNPSDPKYKDLYVEKKVGEWGTETTNAGEIQNFYFGPYDVKDQQAVQDFGIKNYADTGAVTVKKYEMKPDGTSGPLDGASIKIEGMNGEVKVTQTQPSVNGQVTFTNLPIYDANGKKIKYTITETAAPDGFTKSEQKFTVELQAGETVTTGSTSGKESVNLAFVNQPEMELTVEKVYYNAWEHSFTNKEYSLPGTKIALYQWNASDGLYHFVEKMGIKETADEDTPGQETGTVTFEGLEQNVEYVAVEVSVPDRTEYQYLEPQGPDGGHKYLGIEEETGKPKKTTLTRDELKKYNYVKKEANGTANRPEMSLSGKLVNVENWTQLHIEKFVIEEAGHTGITEGDRRQINNAQFNLYMEVLNDTVNDNSSLSFDYTNTAKYTLIGTYSSGTLYDTEGNRLDGWFGTDILKSADNVVYWLEETNAGIGAAIRPESRYTLIKKKGTSYTNGTTYTIPGENGEQTVSCSSSILNYINNGVTTGSVQNDPLYDGDGEMYSTVRIAKWAGHRSDDGEKQGIFDPLGNVTFNLYLADKDGNIIEPLDTLTTGLDNKTIGDYEDGSVTADENVGGGTQNGNNENVNSPENEETKELTAWASSKAFSWTEISALVNDKAVSKRSDIITETADGYYVRVAIQEEEAPSGYMAQKRIYYMYMFFQKKGVEGEPGKIQTTEIFNDAYYVKGDENSADKDKMWAENQNPEVTWALYPTAKGQSGYTPVSGITVPEDATKSGNQYRLINWPVDTHAVTVQKYGYEIQEGNGSPGSGNLNMTSEELDTYYSPGSGHTDRNAISVDMKLQRYADGQWTDYNYNNTTETDNEGIFTTNASGYFAFPNGLRMGRYRIIEENATGEAAQYEMIYDESDLTPDSQDDTPESPGSAAYYFQVGNNDVHITMYNPKKQDLYIKKTGTDRRTTLSGVEFTLTKTTDSTSITGKTGDDGKASLINIGSGTYTLTESIDDKVDPAGYTDSYFKKYFSQAYNNTNGKAGNLVELVGKGIYLGYSKRLEPGENGTSVIVTNKTDITDYGITRTDGIDLNIQNPQKVSFTIRKNDADNPAIYLNGAKFTVDYIAFDKINGENITVEATSTWTKVENPAAAGNDTYIWETAGTQNGTPQGTVTITGDPGIYRITEVAPPSDYDLSENPIQYIALTGGLTVGNITVDKNTVSKRDNSSTDNTVFVDFSNEKQVDLTVTKQIDRGNMKIQGNHKFSFTLYDKDKKLIETKDITVTGTTAEIATFADLSQKGTYYLKETSTEEEFVLTGMTVKGNTNPLTGDGEGFYKIKIPDTTQGEPAAVEVTAVNKYLKGQISFKKVNGESGEPLKGATFRIVRVNGTQETDVQATITDNQNGSYTAVIPFTGNQEETFRIYETKAPQNYLLNSTSCIEFRMGPGNVLSAPELPEVWVGSKYAMEENTPEQNDQAMLADYIFPNYRGAYINVTKYGNVHDANPEKVLAGMKFTLYKKNEATDTWKEYVQEAATDSNGYVGFVVENGIYALEENLPADSPYQGLEGIYDSSDTKQNIIDAIIEKDNGDKEDTEKKKLHVINGGEEVKQGTTYTYRAYNIPYLSLVIRKENSDTSESAKRMTATAAVYEVPAETMGSWGNDPEKVTSAQVTEFIAENSDKLLIDNIDVSKAGSIRNAPYSYADKTTNGELDNILVAGKTYLIVEQTAGIVEGQKTAPGSQIRGSEQVQWYHVIQPPAGSTDEQTAVLRNAEGTAPLTLEKTVDKKNYASLFTEAAEVEYTLTPTVGTNSYPLADFTVNDTGLTAYGDSGELEGYLAGKYSLKQVKIGKASHKANVYSDAGNAPINAIVEFKDNSGVVIYAETVYGVDSINENGSVVTLPEDKGKAAQISVKYESPIFKEATKTTQRDGYALGANFVPGTITITAEIDQQEGGPGKEAITRINNAADSILHYYKWGPDGKEDTTLFEEKDTSAAEISFSGQKAPIISVTKTSDKTGMVALDSTVEYGITITNNSTEEASMQNPFVVDYLPQGTSWNLDEDSNVDAELEAGDTNLTLRDITTQTVNGEKAVFIFLNGTLDKGESATVNLRVKIDNTVTAYGTTMRNYALVGSDIRGAESKTNPNAASFRNGTGNWAQNVDTLFGSALSEERLNNLKSILGETRKDYGYVTASHDLQWTTATDSVLVKSAYGDRNASQGYTTDILSSVNNIIVGDESSGTMHYRLSVSNTSADYKTTNIVVMDILPAIGDFTRDSERESEWKLTFNAISNVYVSSNPTSKVNYKTYYYTGELSGADAYSNLYQSTLNFSYNGLTDQQKNSGWTDTQPAEQSTIKAFVVVTDSSVQLAEEDTLLIEYTARVKDGKTPWTEQELSNNSWKNAVNSFVCTYSRIENAEGGTSPVTPQPLGRVLESNEVSTTTMPNQVQVGGHIWIDKDGDGIREEGESIDDWTDKNNNGIQDEGEKVFAGNVLIQQMLAEVQVKLTTFRGGSSGSERDYIADGSWSTNANYIFDKLDPAVIRDDINTPEEINERVYPGGILNPGALKGTAPSTYTINVTLPNTVTGIYEITRLGEECGRSNHPDQLSDKEKTDNNFTGTKDDHTGVVSASSERFYLWPTVEEVFDNTKDIGIVPYRNLVINKKAKDGGSDVDGVKFALYGPYDEKTVITQANATSVDTGREVTTENGQAVFDNLYWYKQYVIVEESTADGYTLDDTVASPSAGTNLTPITVKINGEDRPAWILGVPDDEKTSAVDTVTVTNNRIPTTATIKAFKTLKNKKLTKDAYSFCLWNGENGVDSIGKRENLLEIAKNDASGNVSFTSRSFDISKVYTYYITEQMPVDEEGQIQSVSSGVTYDGAIWKVEVNVFWDSGKSQLTNTVTYTKVDKEGTPIIPSVVNNDKAEFTNIYGATGSWTPEGSKMLTGRTMKAEEEYTFSVKKDGTEEVSTGTAKPVQDVEEGEEVPIEFTPITYQLSDKGQTYTYTIEENKTGTTLPGVSYDKTIYTVEVTVVDNGEGTLVPQVSYKVNGSEKDRADFTNEYVPTPIKYTPHVLKTLTGDALPEVNGEEESNANSKDFTFTLTKGTFSPEDGAVMPSNSECTKTITINKGTDAPASGTATFGEIIFKKAGTYTFTIRETNENDTGVIYDEEPWTLTVTVSDDGKGVLSKQVTYSKQSSGSGQTQETGPAQPTVITDAEKASFTNEYNPVETQEVLKVSKAVTGIVALPNPDGQKFKFQLSLVSGDEDYVTMPAGAGAEVEITVHAVGENHRREGQFGSITFRKAGRYVFEINEISGIIPGYNLMTGATRYALVEVVDKAGQLESNVTYYSTNPENPDGGTTEDGDVSITRSNAGGEISANIDSDASRFTNEYSVTETSFTPKVYKTLTGDKPKVLRNFTFNIEKQSGDDTGVIMPENRTATVLNGSGSGVFETIRFTKADSYTFKITESIPAEAVDKKYQGYTYDDTEWILTVEVKDTGGKLEVIKHTYKADDSTDNGTSRDDAAAFENSYSTKPDTYAPQVKKTITGADIPTGREDEFDFTLTYKDAESAYVGEDVTGSVKYGSDIMAVNDVKNLTMTGSGESSFEELTFTKAGTYTFEIAETSGNQPGYKYDSSKWTLTVNVVDENGELKATPSYTKAGDSSVTHATFTNTYSVTPDTFTPQVEKQFSDDSVARPNAKDFTFTLTADEQNPAGGAFTGYDETTGSGTALEGANTIETKVNGSGTGAFDTITFTKAGTYKFWIQEEAGSDLGYTYDDAVWTLTVQVDDIGGALQVTNNDVTYQSNDTTVEPNNEKAVFVNEYHYISSIIINKEVLRGNAEYETNDMFYAGIFRKVDNTGGGTGSETGNISYEIVKNVVVDDKTVESGVVQLANNDSVEVYVPLGGEDQTEAITYYVFETDAEGHPLVSFDEDGNAVYNQPFAYEISSESTGEDGTVNGRGEVYVTPDTAGAHPEVTITNRATSVAIEKRDISGNPLTGAVLELWKQADSVDAGVAADEDRTKAANGDILLETWTSDGTPHELTAELAVGGTYYLREAEVPAGYVQAADILFTVENGDPITLIMEDENQANVLGQIQVTKRLSAIDETTFDNIDLVAEDATVYVGLFTDAQGEHPYGEDYVKEIHIQDASSGTVTFDNLPSGTYYVFETQQDGTVIPYGELQADAAGSGAGFICAGDGSNGGVKEITLNPDTGAPEGSTELGNVYYGDLPDGFAYQGELMITKAVMKDGAPADSSDTFYAGIFTSETETVPYKVVALENNGTVTVEVPLGGENGMDSVTYYIYETDADGNKIDKNSFAYTVSGEGTVDLDVDNTTAGRTIINTMASDPDTTRTIREKNDSDTKKISTDTSKKSTGTNRRTSSSKTGDDTRVGLYLLFFAAAAVGIILTLRKRKEDKPE